MDTIHIFDHTDDLSEAFTQMTLQATSENNVVNISLSGGSTPKALFDFWASRYQKKMPWEKIRFFWGDERCVPPDDEMSNFGMTRQHLLDKVNIAETNIFRIHGENDPEQEARRYGHILDTNLPALKGSPQFDIMLLGLGDDGHTASVFPHEMHLWESPQNCVVASHPQTGMKRISLTGNVINNARHVVFLATGKNKAEKVRDIIQHRADFIEKYPAARVAPLSGKLSWYLDREAAALLP